MIPDLQHPREEKGKWFFFSTLFVSFQWARLMLNISFTFGFHSKKFISCHWYLNNWTTATKNNESTKRQNKILTKNTHETREDSSSWIKKWCLFFLHSVSHFNNKIVASPSWQMQNGINTAAVLVFIFFLLWFCKNLQIRGTLFFCGFVFEKQTNRSFSLLPTLLFFFSFFFNKHLWYWEHLQLQISFENAPHSPLLLE